MDISSNLKQLMIEFALNEDMDYRLKENESQLLCDGLTYGLRVNVGLIKTVEEVFKPDYQIHRNQLSLERFKDILTQNYDEVYRKLLSKVEQNTMSNPNFLKIYNQKYSSQQIAKNLEQPLSGYASGNKYFAFPDQAIKQLSSNKHLEKLLKV